MTNEEDAVAYAAQFAKLRMTDEELKARAEVTFKFAVHRATDSTSEPEEPSIMPWMEVVYVTVEEGSGIASERMTDVYALAVSDNEKAAIIRKIGEKLSEPGKNIIPLAAFFTCEAWVAQRSAPKPGEKYVRPIDDPNSKDAIMMIASTIDQRVGTAKLLVDKAKVKDGVVRTVPNGETQWLWTMDGTTKIFPGVLRHLWMGFFERFMALKKAREQNPNG